METNKTKLNYCPSCTSKINAVTGATGTAPKPNDVTICCYCAEILEFNEHLTLTNISGQSLSDINIKDLRKLFAIQDEILAFNKTKDGFPMQQSKDNVKH